MRSVFLTFTPKSLWLPRPASGRLGIAALKAADMREATRAKGDVEPQETLVVTEQQGLKKYDKSCSRVDSGK